MPKARRSPSASRSSFANLPNLGGVLSTRALRLFFVALAAVGMPNQSSLLLRAWQSASHFSTPARLFSLPRLSEPTADLGQCTQLFFQFRQLVVDLAVGPARACNGVLGPLDQGQMRLRRGD